MEPTIKTLATKDDIASLREEWRSGLSDLRKEWGMGISDIRKEMESGLSGLRKEIGEGNVKLHKKMAENIKWMFIYSISQVAAFWFILELLLKK